MQRKPLMLTMAALIVGAAALTGCRQGTEDPVAPPAQQTGPERTGITPSQVAGTASATTAVSIVAVELGTSTGSDQRVVDPTRTFSPTDGTIRAAIVTQAISAEPVVGNLAARWTFEDGQVVDENTQSTTFTDDGVTVFTISNPNAWPTGDYKLEVSLDGEVVETVDFSVR